MLVRLTSDEGLVGWGDASDAGNDELVIAAVAALGQRLIGEELAPSRVGRHLARVGSANLSPRLAGLQSVTAAGALEQASWDYSRSLGVSLCDLLGGRISARLPLYANINRALRDHEPESFAGAAKAAVEAGFAQVKVAPFRGVHPRDSLDVAAEAIREGLKRIDAVATEIRDKAELLVDCHGRFDQASVRRLMRALESVELGWVEEPCLWQEDPDGLRAARESSSHVIAAGELLSDMRAYRTMIETGFVDVVMTDVRCAGGLRAVLDVTALGRASGRLISLHNPSSPVGTMHSAHVTAATPGIGVLEYPFDPARTELVARLTPGAEVVEDGALVVSEGPGIGIEFDPDVLAQVSQRLLSVTRRDL